MSACLDETAGGGVMRNRTSAFCLAGVLRRFGRSVCTSDTRVVLVNVAEEKECLLATMCYAEQLMCVAEQVSVACYLDSIL